MKLVITERLQKLCCFGVVAIVVAVCAPIVFEISWFVATVAVPRAVSVAG